MTFQGKLFRAGLIAVLTVELWFAAHLRGQAGELSAQARRDQKTGETKTEALKVALQRNTRLGTELQTLKTGRGKGDSNEAGADASDAGSGTFMDRFDVALASPTFRKNLATQQKALLPPKYGELFTKLKLDADQVAAFEDLLVQRQLAKTDALMAIRGDKATVSDEAADFRQAAVADAQKDVDAKIQSLLGDAGFAQYLHYEATNAMRETVNQIGQALSYTSTPLSPAQANELVETFYGALPDSEKGHVAGWSAETGAGLLPPRSIGPAISSSSLAAARSLLAPEQLAVVERLAAAQAAHQKLEELAGARNKK